MNKQTIITVLIALVAIVANAQQRLTVRDSLTQEPVEYTSVWFGNEAGGYTDESGVIEIPQGTGQIPIFANLRFDLRLPDAETGAPRDESIIGGGVLCLPDQRIGNDGVRLPTPIPFPKTGVFVVLEWITTAKVSESHSLVPSLNMTLNVSENRTWNRKTFRGTDWMPEQDEPIYQDESAREFYRGRIPCAKLGLEITK